MRIGIYPGSFDPITYGHIDIIKRALNVVDILVVSVLYNKNKKALLGVGERLELIKLALNEEIIDKGMRERVIIDSFSGLLADYADKQKASIIIRGVRSVSDYEYEASMARINKKLNGGIETVLLVTDSQFIDVSSSVVKEISSFNGDISKYVPSCVIEYIEDIK